MGEAFARTERMRHCAHGTVGLIWAELTEFGSLPKADLYENPSLLSVPGDIL
jgi:hypothetical protein